MHKISNADNETVNKTFLIDHKITLPQESFHFLAEQYQLEIGNGVDVDLIIDNHNASGHAKLTQILRKNRRSSYLNFRFSQDVYESLNKIYEYSLSQYNEGNELNYESYELYFSEKDKVFHLKCITAAEMQVCETDEISDQSTDNEPGYKKSAIIGENRIYYGNPGCGKSHFLKAKIKDDRFDKSYRTTFYPDYSYSDFVGQIYPQVEGKKVLYEFIPGSFTQALKYALDNENEKVALVIEEINRGNAPTIFGDIFQLIDRNKDGRSEYGINNILIQKHLSLADKVYIPANLFIYATMNTSDQNVFTLDTAFKRRWKMTKVPNTFEKGDAIGEMLIPDFTVSKESTVKNVTWQSFVETINKHIVNNSSMINAEDKQLGKYFVTEADLITKNDLVSKANPDEESQREKMIEDKAEEFANKVLEYIWSDVSKFNRKDWFAEGIKSFDEVLKKRDFMAIFTESIVADLWNENKEPQGNQPT